MGLFDKVERKLESAVNGVFARAFRAEVQPVEVASAMRRAMDDRAAVVGKGRTIVPNLFVIDLAPSDYERLTSYAELLADELVASVQEHAEQQHYVPGGPFHIDFRSRDDLETGVFRVRPATAKRVPAAADPSAAAVSSAAGPASDERRRGHAEELRRAHPFRPAESEAPALGAAGLASHAASAAAGSLAGTAAAARAGGAGPFAPPTGVPEAGLAAPPGHNAERVAPEVSQRPNAPGSRGDGYGGDGQGATSYAPERTPNRPQSSSYGDPGQPAPTAPTAAAPPSPPIDPTERPWLDCDGDHYPLLGALTVLGRDGGADITLEDAGISRRHAELRVTHDGPHYAISIRDLGSTNGTFVNGDRVAGNRRISDGDRITLGRSSLVIRTGRR